MSEPKFKPGDWVDWNTGTRYDVLPPSLEIKAIEWDGEQSRWGYRLAGVEYPVYEEVLTVASHPVCPTPEQRKKVMGL